MKLRAVGAAIALAFVLATPVTARADDTACIDASEKDLALRRAGKLHDSLKQLAICGAPTCPKEIAEECARRAQTVAAAMPTLILSATDGAGNDIAAAKIMVDGAVIGDKLDGQPLALDPGPHTVRLEHDGIALEKTLVMRESEKARRENFLLAKPAPPKPAAPPFDEGLGPQRTAALVAGGVGVAGLVLGIISGSIANHKKSSEQSACSTSGCPDYPAALDDYGTAHSFATVSTISFIAGGVLIAGGVVLWLTAPKSSGSSSPTAGMQQPLRWTF